MIVQGLTFYMFALIAIASGVMVISAKNPVHSVLFLILAFFNVAGLFVLLGAEFLAMILVVVYVGAVAVLFMFVVMMLDVDFAELREGFLQYLPVGGIIGAVLAIELILVLGATTLSPDAAATAVQPIPDLAETSNIKAIGDLLYSKYIFLFESAGLILLVAMVGAIVLTHRKSIGTRGQNISSQVQRRPQDAVRNMQPGVGQGVEL